MHEETYAQQITRFMRWAERRIAEEVEANKELELALGDAENLTEGTLSRKRRIFADTDLEKLAIIKEVDKLRRLGLTTKRACANNNVSDSAYLSWRKKLNLGKFKK